MLLRIELVRECLLEVDDLSCPNVFFALFLILPISLFRQDKGGEWCDSLTPDTVLSHLPYYTVTAVTAY